MQLRSFFLILFSVYFIHLTAQVKIGQWVDHLPYTETNTVSKNGNIVYVSNGTALAKYNTADNSVEKLTKYNGLSDVGIQLLRKNPYNNRLLVIYKNTNIDVIDIEGGITNFSDIKRKSIQGKKYINEVYFYGKMAYLACGFGIAVFDTDKLEIKETFYIGNGIANYEVYQVTKNDTAFFAATSNGVFYGKSILNLGNYQNWKPLNTGIANGPYNAVVNFNGKVLVNYSHKIKTGQDFKDTIYQLEINGVWNKYSYKTNSTIRKMYDYSSFGRLGILDQWGALNYDANGATSVYITYYGFDYAAINDVYHENDGHYWIADQRLGLVDSKVDPQAYNSRILLNGPSTYMTNDLDCLEGYLYMAPTNLGDEWINKWNWPEVNVFHDESWQPLMTTYMDSCRDINCVSVDQKDKSHVVFGSWWKGVVEYKNNVPVNIYNVTNSSIAPASGTTNEVYVGGVFFDENSNMWVTSAFTNKLLNVKTASGSWVNFNFNSITNANPNAIMPNNPYVGKVIVDKKGLVWIQLARGSGMIVFNPGESFSQPSPSNAKVISTSIGSGALPTSDIYSMAEDKDGNIWVGTGTGVAVFYNTDNIFSAGNWDAQQILIEQDGHVQILLENDNIRSIAVDGANRKWLGTLSSGIYCMSPDGQKEIYHFTTENSPLYSNTVRDIAIDETTGDVFIATDFGIQSYRTDIIKGYDDFTKVHAYPNPIRPGYSAPVYITGLIDEAVVKITDVAGNIVWQTKSQGGQISWDMKTFNGSSVANGVYMIYCASENGEKYATAKLMIMK